MRSSPRPERPYRSHLQPACVPCRRRKSRCQREANSNACLMCRVHRTECLFPEASSQQTPERKRPRTGRLSQRPPPSATPSSLAPTTSIQAPAPVHQNNTYTETNSREHIRNNGLSRNSHQHRADTSLTLDSADEQHLNMHIVGPAATNDSQVLADYLSGIPGATRSTRMIVPESTSRSRPVLFTMVQKRPVGVTVKSSPSAEKLEIIEKLLEPFAEDLVDEYVLKVTLKVAS